MDKKLAREFVKKVGPLEHSKNPYDQLLARKFEAELKAINKVVPKPTPPARLRA